MKHLFDVLGLLHAYGQVEELMDRVMLISPPQGNEHDKKQVNHLK